VLEEILARPPFVGLSFRLAKNPFGRGEAQPEKAKHNEK
jgi:hypothetical protein